MKFILITAFLLFHFSLFGQSDELSEEIPIAQLMVKVDSLIQVREFKDADSILSRIENEDIISLSNDQKVLYHVLTGKIKRSERKLDSARLAYLQGIEWVDETTPLSLKATLYKDLGIVSYYLSDYEMLKAYYDIALPCYYELKDSTQIGNAYTVLGNVSNIQGNSPKALDFYLKAESVISEQKDKRRLSMVLNNIGIVYNTQRDTIEALKYHRKSLALAIEMEDSVAITRSYRSIANAIIEQNPKLALDYYQKCIPIQQVSNDQRGLGVTYSNIGSTYLKFSAFDKALANLRIALSTHQKFQYHQGIDYAHLYFGQAYYGLAMTDSAAYYFNKALDGAKKSGDKTVLSEALKGLYKLEKTSGDYQLALTHFEAHKAIYDSLQNNEATKKITQLQMQHSFDEEKREIKVEQELKEAIFKKDAERNRLLLGGSFSLIFVLCFAAFWAWRAYKIKKNSLRELTEKNGQIMELARREKKLLEESVSLKERELASMAMAAHEKNSLLSELEQKINHVEQTLEDNQKSNLKKIKKTIASGYSMDKSWSSFQDSFELIHPGFMKKFKDQNPDLSIEDLKLGAYLKIGMTNKEIASITNITHGSVKVKVNRLKTKLNMGPADDFRDFMLKYV